MIPKKRGKWSKAEDKIIMEGLQNGESAEEILKTLTENDVKGRSRELFTVKRRMQSLQINDTKRTNLDESHYQCP